MSEIRVPDWIATQLAKQPKLSAEELAELERQEREQARRDELQRERREAEQRLVSTGTPRRIRELLGGALDNTRPLRRIRAWVAEPSSWCLALSSNTGTGKSVAAGWWLRECGHGAAKGRNGNPLRRWWTAAQLSCTDWFGGSFQDIAEMDGPLVIDDLGVEYSDAKGFFQQRLDALMDARYSELRPLLVTTNLNAKEFRERYGKRVADRFREGGAFYEFTAESMRGRQAPERVEPTEP